MSNELPVPVPEYLKNLGNQAAGDTAAAIASSISVPRLSLRGKVFRFVENGEEIFKTNQAVEVIILGVEPEAGRMIKTYYEKGYQPGNTDPPDCASHDGIRPSPWVNKKQSDTCQACKWNAFGSAISPNGKPTKKCRDAKQLWVLRKDDPKGPDGVQYGLNVSVSSLKAFSEYGRKLQAHNLPFAAVITKLDFEDSEFPQLKFELGGFVSKENIESTLKIQQERPWKMMASAIALAAPDNAGGPALALPGSTASPAIPPHVQQAVAAQQPATTPAAPGASPSDILNKW